MGYIFYADVYFIQNFMIKIAVLYLVFYCDKRYEITETIKGIGKMVAGSFFATVFEILILVFFNNYNFFLIVVNIVELPLLFLGIGGYKGRKVIPLILLGYFFILLINGILEILWNQFGERGGFFFFLLLASGVVVVSVRIWKNYSKMKKGICKVQILHQGKHVSAKGFYDSGNQLIDPYTKQGVHIISEQLFENLEIRQNYVLIPYQALGNEEGMLEVYYLDEIIIKGEKSNKTIQNCPVGVTKDNLFEGKTYEIILNEEVF
ncbi:MAG: sigma-E processing peptidase SpoIIGA [Agathobacter sp.]|nr:sigma-E processing peptidase SpoIIGA [Agathobacter sp.]